MALQIEISEESVVYSGAGKEITLRLQCWAEGADTKVADPVIDVTESGYVKAEADAKSDAELIKDAIDLITQQFQNVIDKYKTCKPIGDNIDVVAIRDALVG